MWSVAMTDFFQMIIIMVGMLIVGAYVADLVPQGMGGMLKSAADNGMLNPFPAMKVDGALNYSGMFAFVAALLTLGF
ncbi:MAG: hypothetical protein QMC36_05570 [Patescibacteria group bacterium]